MKSTTAGSSTGGLVSGRMTRLVTPPAAAAALALAIVSRCSAPGSPTKARMSMRPGETTSPLQSMTRASGGSWSRVTAGPRPAMTPSMAMRPPRVSVSRAGSTRRALRRAIGEADTGEPISERRRGLQAGPRSLASGSGQKRGPFRTLKIFCLGLMARARAANRLLALHLDLLDRLLRLGGLRQHHGEDAFLEARPDLVDIDSLGDPQRALERTKATLPEAEVLLLLFLLLALLALDGQDAVGHFDLDVLLVHPGKIGVDFISVVAFDEIDRRERDPGLGRPEGLNVEHRPSERQPERAHIEVVEQPVDLAAQVLERTPHLHRIRGRFGLRLGRDRNLCLSLRHRVIFCHRIAPSC